MNFKSTIFAAFFLMLSGALVAQDTSDIKQGGSSRFFTSLPSDSRLSIGAYGEAHYNQPIGDKRYNGKMDVHRLVPFIGYNFSNRASFFTEIEIEHVKEIYVEQAFVDYRINRFMNFRGGLLLVPFGIINEYHEPPTFFSVERPKMDHDIIPSTWRELGAGFTGNFNRASIRYQVYVMNGFSSYSGGAGSLGGGEGLRDGRQKAAKSMISNPNFTGKIEYFGLRGLRVGVSGYFGKTSSSLYNGLDQGEDALVARADSSLVGVGMVAGDLRYNRSGFTLRGQYALGKLDNVQEYNVFTGRDLGTSMQGYYVEAGYNFLRLLKKQTDQKIVLFGRYSDYDTHETVGEIAENDAYDRQTITFGMNYHLAKGVVLKADYQINEDAAGNDLPDVFNAGVGVWFY